MHHDGLAEESQSSRERNIWINPNRRSKWKGTRHRDMTKKIRDFLLKHLHETYRLGRAWDHIPGCKDSALCPMCNEYDTLEHIMIECTSAERETVWVQAVGGQQT
jgi:hypothetical protein